MCTVVARSLPTGSYAKNRHSHEIEGVWRDIESLPAVFGHDQSWMSRECLVAAGDEEATQGTGLVELTSSRAAGKWPGRADPLGILGAAEACQVLGNMNKTAVLLAACLAATPPHLFSQQPSAPTFKSGLEILTVEASVRDGTGRPVTDLQASDFAVSIDGRPRRVLNARLYGVEAERIATAGTPMPRFTRSTDAEPGRLVMFAVDRDSIRSGSEEAILDTAADMMTSFSPADAVGVIGLPLGGIDPTRDHAAAAAALQLMTGTRPSVTWKYYLSWEEAIEFERAGGREATVDILRVLQRECSVLDNINRDCLPDISNQARDMLQMGRGHAQTVLTRLGDLFDSVSTVRAPKHLVLFSGGMPFDVDLLSRYRELATKAARARVAIFVVLVDQASFDASDRKNVATVFGGRDFATGLGDIASSTGGMFVNAIGTAKGALNRISADINSFYQLGVEALPTDADGKTHRVKVEVSRPNLSIRAPAEIAAAPRVKSSAVEAVTSALAQPTDTAEVPFEVATYSTHADDPGKVRLIVAATVPEAPGFVPAEWGYVVLDGGKVVGGSRDRIVAPSSGRWLGTASLVVPVGKYRIRTAVVAADGRVASLDLPLSAGLRAAGAVQASDLIVGSPNEGRVEPRARLNRSDAGVAMLELSSPEPLTGTTGVVELTRAGTAQPAMQSDLELRARARDTTVVAAQAALDLSKLAPGTYMASAVLARGGQPFARVSRLIEVVPGEPTDAPVPVPSTATAGPPAGGALRDPALEDVLQRVGRYVAGYGQQASLIIAVERYEQRYQNAPAGERPQRKLVAEFALFRTVDATGWVGFRDVMSVDGKPIPDRQDRLQALLRAGTPDILEARRIADESARFNIGPTRRNFNEPTAALFFLLPASQKRFAFTRQGMTTVGGVTAMEIDFRETGSPTMIRTSDGRDVASQGTIWVLPADGTVLRTRLNVLGFGGPGSSSSVDVTFARDERLQLWLPVKMTERYEAGASIARSQVIRIAPAVVSATATYGEFKRFETSTSISVK
jgi:VWFA-related protein